jgi:hypothetical protein
MSSEKSAGKILAAALKAGDGNTIFIVLGEGQAGGG